MGETWGCLIADRKKPDKEGLEIQLREMPGRRAPSSPKEHRSRGAVEFELGRQNG